MSHEKTIKRRRIGLSRRASDSVRFYKQFKKVTDGFVQGRGSPPEAVLPLPWEQRYRKVLTDGDRSFMYIDKPDMSANHSQVKSALFIQSQSRPKRKLFLFED